MRISLFKQKGPKGFQFKPRYYNAEREELMARVEVLKRDLEADDKARESYQGGEALRQKMRANRGHHSKMSSARKKSNTRVFMIAGLLGIAIYWYLTH